ncbi:E3 ubiquitin-protein ligase TRIM15-like [Lepidochelys kempii]|uniref:E3 ubiquitin-protein ligase TRIM15-like n=1 Tax=Lepidochelys kempii TaxID=8472 RepID=UPI003C6F07CA
MSEFEQLRQFLDEQERLLLAQLEELDKEIVKIQDENVTKLSEKISRLGDLISEIEEKCQQPTSEFLQEQIQTQLNTLKQERGELLEWKQDAETQSQEYLGKIEAERQKIMSEFEQLRQFLDEQERLLLAQLEELDKEIVKIQDENVTKRSEKISRLGDLISEIEEKCQQPTSEFLQDIKSTWSRCEKVKFEKPMAVPQDVSERVGVSSQRNVCLQEALKKFRDSVPQVPPS